MMLLVPCEGSDVIYYRRMSIAMWILSTEQAGWHSGNVPLPRATLRGS